MTEAEAIAKEKAAEAREDMRRVSDAYLITFGSAAGSVVLKDLQARFGSDRPRFAPGRSALDAAMMDGQSQVTYHIESVVEQAKESAGVSPPPIKQT